MEDTEHNNSGRFFEKEDLEGKSPRESPANVLVDNRVLLWGASDGVQDGVHGKKEL